MELAKIAPSSWRPNAGAPKRETKRQNPQQSEEPEDEARDLKEPDLSLGGVAKDGALRAVNGQTRSWAEYRQKVD